jgi:hypothetical protein
VALMDTRTKGPFFVRNSAAPCCAAPRRDWCIPCIPKVTLTVRMLPRQNGILFINATTWKSTSSAKSYDGCFLFDSSWWAVHNHSRQHLHRLNLETATLSNMNSSVIVIKVKVKGKLSLRLPKYKIINICPVLNKASRHQDVWEVEV